jgi:hypothetical protein
MGDPNSDSFACVSHQPSMLSQKDVFHNLHEGRHIVG